MTNEEYIKLQVDAYAKTNNLSFMFNSYSYDKYISKLTDKERKEHITIIIICGKDILGDIELPNTSKKIYDIGSDIFKNIQVYYSPYVDDNYQNISFSDDRIDGMDVYKSYIDMVPEELK